MSHFEKGQEVSFQHAITRKEIVSKVYDTCYQGDQSTWTVQLKVAEGCLVWIRMLDCKGVPA